jgi:hypothetical protein
MQLESDLSQADTERVLEKLDVYEAAGLTPAQAARKAVKDVLAEYRAERKDITDLIEAAIDTAPEVADTSKKAGRAAARAELEKIAGKVGLKFSTENSYDWQGHVVTLAVAPDASVGTIFHEAFHAIFKSLRPNERSTLYKALATPSVRKQLRELLKGSPEAISAIETDSEELAAYAFQFYKLGMLDINGAAQNWYGKLQRMISEVAAWLKDQPSAKPHVASKRSTRSCWRRWTTACAAPAWVR